MKKIMLFGLLSVCAVGFASAKRTAAAKSVRVEAPSARSCAKKAPLRIAEEYDPNKNCSCRQWRIYREKVCVETDANGRCTKKEDREVGRECIDWACHDKA